jgi:hypothetical protein
VVVVERAWSFGDDELDSISRVGQITRSVRLVACTDPAAHSCQASLSWSPSSAQQLKQRFAIDLVFFERIDELSEAVRLEPSTNIAHITHCSSSSSALASFRSAVSKPSVNQP